MRKMLVLSVILVLLLAGCQTQEPVVEEPIGEEIVSGADNSTDMGMGMSGGMGMSSGMRNRHHAAIPEPYAGVVNETEADAASLQRGEEIFIVQCASCHGEQGMGDGPAATGFDPAPAPIAHTSQMMSDAYLLWRISEGGVPFETQMPAWKTILDEGQIWDVINYLQALGAGTVGAGPGMGNQNADAQAARHAEMLAAAVEQEIITQAEADTFELVHAALDIYLAENPPEGGGMEDHQATALAALVEVRTLTQEQVDVFNSVHDRLVDSGLMQ